MPKFTIQVPDGRKVTVQADSQEQAISGVQGFRGNQSAIQQVTDHLPKITDTVDTINQKVAYIRALVSDREDSIVGKPQAKAETAAVIPAEQVPAGYYQASDGLLYKK